VVRERIKELVDFATTESPYRDANKGWVTDDVYIKWGSSVEKNSLQGQELANIAVYWKPINQIVFILFAVIFLASILVFTSVSFAHGRFKIPIGTDNTIYVPESESFQIGLREQRAEQEQDINLLVSADLDPLAQTKLEVEKTSKQVDFAAAALGGQPLAN